MGISDAIRSRYRWLRRERKPRLTLFARCLLIMTLEVLANAFLWILSAILFTRGNDRRVLSLALVAWTTGLRHGLDADHISAIDNATRRIVSVPVPTRNGKDVDAEQPAELGGPSQQQRRRRPVTVGLFFSLGHSTIVFATTVAIAISASVATHLDGVSSVGGIIGASVSGSFLFLIGCINSVILYRTWMRLRRARRREALQRQQKQEGGEGGAGEATNAQEKEQHHFNGLMTRLALPLLKAVDRPWKMFPVGVLFGLGFDTASSIALLGVAALAFQHANKEDGGGPDGDSRVILLALLFTAGMTMVDSADSCLMIWAYAPERTGPGRKRFALLLREPDACQDEQSEEVKEQSEAMGAEEEGEEKREEMKVTMEKANEADTEKEKAASSDEDKGAYKAEEGAKPEDIQREAQSDKMMSQLDSSASRFSLLLTLLSILVAFAISIIVLLGLIGDECARCSRAADQQETTGDGGLEGRWWLAWRRANDNSGYVGAAIVGIFALCVLVYFGASLFLSRRRKRKAGL